MDTEENPIERINQVGDALAQWTATFDPSLFVAVCLFFAIVYWLRRPLARLSVKATVALMKKAGAALSEEVTGKLAGASEVLIVTLAAYIGIQILDLPQIAGGLLERVAISVAVIAIFSAWYRLAGPFISLLLTEKPSDVRVEQDWIVRATRFAIVLFGVTSLLKVWHIDISGALTGVGVLGAGLAIAAQDLVRNLIAGITNLTEERFEVGDAIEVPDAFIGTVARVDLRSTLILGFDQIRRYVPNSELANSVVMNYSRMKYRRIWMEIPLVLSTTEEQIHLIKAGLDEFWQKSGLFDNGKKSPKYIYANKITDHAIEILFVAHTQTGGYEDMLKASEKLNLRIMQLVEEVGTELAYPTQTVNVEQPVS